jgi:hypothetical protein
MSEITITTSGELHLNGDFVGRIEWLKPFVESFVAGTFTQDDPFVDEWGARIDCTSCSALDELHTENERQVRGVQRLLTLTRKRLASIGGAGGPVDQHLIQVEDFLGNMEFET